MNKKYLDFSKDACIHEIINLISRLRDHKYRNLPNFKINKFEDHKKEHNFYLNKRLFEIQKHPDQASWDILAETKANSPIKHKIGGIPCRFLTHKDLIILCQQLLSLAEHEEIIVSIDELDD
jgi:hypothetical protein